MITLSLVGIGSGNPEHLTLEAVRKLQGADVILLPRKGAEKTALADLRRHIATEMLSPAPRVVEFDYPKRDADTPEYTDGVTAWHDAIAAIWAELIARHVRDGGRVALMVWGDPALYDSTLRIADRVIARGLEMRIDVVPGITSLSMLTSAHAIPLNTLAGAVQITTGRNLRAAGWPEGAETLAVMLDGECSFQCLPPEGIHIWWGAYVGMAQQITLSGPLSKMAPEIVDTRARARAENGWIMDIYILRKGAN
ncbi:precorrin-6A synthase (deacetylating) [Salinihabitans flavidus]|uniref:Precorrin-6A synthase [deacetylating] n=1 Tax=Salinihabitans flavidus TaxID=569882 RepID=A0A1H8Q538_9RHOB|nr:precorrin-6A synthase (deacetylating) [Salinihabitans flavidus]SEO49339.1 precorrin-6A synthase (deacetylating) [Salinihabitans flavidus]